MIAKFLIYRDLELESALETGNLTTKTMAGGNLTRQSLGPPKGESKTWASQLQFCSFQILSLGLESSSVPTPTQFLFWSDLVAVKRLCVFQWEPAPWHSRHPSLSAGVASRGSQGWQKAKWASQFKISEGLESIGGCRAYFFFSFTGYIYQQLLREFSFAPMSVFIYS